MLRNLHYILVVGWIALSSKTYDELLERTKVFLMSDKDIQAKRPLHTHFLYERITGLGDNCARIYKKCNDPTCFGSSGISQEALATFENITPKKDTL